TIPGMMPADISMLTREASNSTCRKQEIPDQKKTRKPAPSLLGPNAPQAREVGSATDAEEHRGSPKNGETSLTEANQGWECKRPRLPRVTDAARPPAAPPGNRPGARWNAKGRSHRRHPGSSQPIRWTMYKWLLFRPAPSYSGTGTRPFL